MLKKLLTLAAAGIISFTAASCEKEIKKEVPAQVTLENVHYYEFEKGVPGCIYDSNGDAKGGMSNPGKGQFALSLDIKIKDPNNILYVKNKYGNIASDSTPEVLTEKKTEHVSGISAVGWTKYGWGDAPLTVEVADYMGNVTKHNFPLDEIIKQSKPFTVKERIGGSCLTTRDTPPTVTLENVYYHEFEPNVPMCLYIDGHYRGSSDEPGEDSFALSFSARIMDPDKILYDQFKWSGYESRPHVNHKGTKETVSSLGMVGPGKKWHEKDPLIVEVADYKGNVTRHEFTLDEMVKQSKPYGARKKVGKHCPRNLE